MALSSRRLSDQIAERSLAKRHVDLASALNLVPASERDEVSERATSSFESGDWPEAPLVKLTSTQQLPSCFGITESYTAQGSHCSNCPLADKCLAFGRKTKDVTTRLTGFSSPVWEIDKRRSAKNTAEFRRRKRRVEDDAVASGAG